MVLRNFEDRLERLVEGMFARAFRTGLQPVEIGRRLIRGFDANRTLDVHGHPVGPNRFAVRLAPADHDRFAQIHDSLIAELRTAVREHAFDDGARFLGPLVIDLTEDVDLTVGMLGLETSFDERARSGDHLAFLELPDGRLVALTRQPATIGRLPESTVVLSDPNASREHAQLRLDGDTYELIDLGSTNGSKVNGVKVGRQLLREGDELTFGTITLRFRLA